MPRRRRRSKNFADLVDAVIPPEARGKPTEIWFQDEARVGQKGTLTRVWARRGSRPPAPRDQRYDWAYLFGAVCPARRAAAAVVHPEPDPSPAHDAGRANRGSLQNSRARPGAPQGASVKASICRPWRQFSRLLARPKRSCPTPEWEKGMMMSDSVLARVAALKKMPTAELKQQWKQLFE